MGELLGDLLITIVGVLTGGLMTIATGLHFYNKQRREQITQKYIDEFLSEAMLRHRIVAAKIRERLPSTDSAPKSNNDVFSMERLARGFWNGGPREPYDYYKGPVDPITGLNEHQSIEAILQYISRLIMNIERGTINVEEFRLATQGSFMWLDELLYPLEKEIFDQVREHEMIKGGSVRAIDRIKKLDKLMRDDLGIDRRE